MATALAAEAALAVGGVPAAHDRDGRAVQSSRHAARALRGISFGRALGVNTLGAARRAARCSACCSCRSVGAKFALLLVAAGYLALVVATRVARRRRSGSPSPRRCGARDLGAVARDRRRARRRAARQLQGRRDGDASASSKMPRGVATSAHQQPAAGRQQRDAASPTRGKRCCRSCCIPRRSARCSSGSAPASRRRSATRGPDAAGRRRRAAARSHRRVGVLHARAADAGAQSRGCTSLSADAQAFRARERRALRRDRRRQLPSGAQRLRLALHRGAFQRGARRGSRRAALFCQWLPLHQLDLDTLRSIVRSFPRRVSARLGDARDEQPGHAGARARRAQGRRSASISQQVRARLRRRSVARSAAELGIDDDLALLGSFIAGPRALAAFRRRRAAQHRRPTRRRVSRAAHHLCARIRCRAIG